MGLPETRGLGASGMVQGIMVATMLAQPRWPVSVSQAGSQADSQADMAALFQCCHGHHILHCSGEMDIAKSGRDSVAFPPPPSLKYLYT
jgi:hypothetical protein